MIVDLFLHVITKSTKKFLLPRVAKPVIKKCKINRSHLSKERHCVREFIKLTLKVLVATIDAQWEGMGDVGSARYEPSLLPPCPTIKV